MNYRNGNYSAFYVSEPFDEYSLGQDKLMISAITHFLAHGRKRIRTFLSLIRIIKLTL